MEDGLVPATLVLLITLEVCLNPCCDGRWSRTTGYHGCESKYSCLNPCCDGRWSRTYPLNI